MSKNSNLAILFADIAGSTELYDTVGDKKAQKLIATCLSALTDVTTRNLGTVVKTIGDEIMCTFPAAESAVQASTEMHQAIDKIPDIESYLPYQPNLYIGFHFGKVIMKNNDVFGDAVNIAARIVSIAKQRQTLTTEQTIKMLPRKIQSEVRFIGKTRIKGKFGKFSLYEVIWEEELMTVIATSSESAIASPARLVLRYRAKTVEMNQTRTKITCGRQDYNDIVVEDNHVSRSHARIEYRRGKFILTDVSSNGTYVLERGEKGIYLKQDELQLDGKGMIGLGEELEFDSPKGLYYNIK